MSAADVADFWGISDALQSKWAKDDHRTSMGERKVTVRLIGPASIMKSVRVGVIWMSVTVALPSPMPSWPIHWNVAPSIPESIEHLAATGTIEATYHIPYHIPFVLNVLTGSVVWDSAIYWWNWNWEDNILELLQNDIWDIWINIYWFIHVYLIAAAM